jgi:hypothetical protein
MGILIFQKCFWEILMMDRVRFLFDHKTEERYCYLPVSNPTSKPSIINTMPFDAAQLTAFWTSPDQMGLSARTRT